METLLNYLHQGVSAAGPFIILLGILIFVHELGHFLVAKWSGVRVEVFSLGFGKKILKYVKGETTYCISLVPLGGYVKMYGDEVGAEVPDEDKKYSFIHKNVWKRIAIVIAGPLMNFIFAIFVFFIVAQIGETVRQPILGDVMIDSAAYKDGFRSGDEILSINKEPMKTWDEIQKKLTLYNGTKITFEVKREVGHQILEIQSTSQLVTNPNPMSLEEQIGEIPGLADLSRGPISKGPMIGVRPGSKASLAGLKTGDHILSINDQQVDYFREIENRLLPLQKQEIVFKIQRYSLDEKEKPLELTILSSFGEFSSMNVIGIEAAELYLAKVMENSPAKKGGLSEGDRILTVNKTEPKTWEQVLNVVKSFSGSNTDGIEFKIMREDGIHIYSVTPQLTSQMTHHGAEEKRYTVGILPWVLQSPPKTFVMKTEGYVNAMLRGAKKAWEVTIITAVSFLRLAQNRISAKNIGGVISIGQVASETFKVGMSQFLTMMGIISINLFVLNLLPIPVLDGGHLLFYIIEAIRGAPVSMRKMEIAQQIGLVLLVALMIFALFNDFSRVFGF